VGAGKKTTTPLPVDEAAPARFPELMSGNMAQTPSDRAIIDDILNGNVNVFELLLDRYQNQVFQIVRKHVPRQNVPEVAQETFVRAFQSLGNFRERGSFKHWLAKIAVRCCYDFWREHYRNREVPVSAISDDCRIWMENILADQSQEEEKERQEARELLEWALGQLSPADRTVLTLTYLEEYPLSEAAELLGWSVINVKVRSYRARQKLRKVIEKIISSDG
jgi:RNA polymerase sigma-70 factor (ECF subfamily)